MTTAHEALRRLSVHAVSLTLTAALAACTQNPFIQLWRGSPTGELTESMSAKRAVLAGGEATIGNLIADAMLENARRIEPDTALALINAGTIRYDEIKARDGVYPAGPLLSDMIDSMLPFDNRIVLATVMGAELRQVMERSVSSHPDVAKHFLQVSEGCHIVVDTAEAPQVLDASLTRVITKGSRVRAFALNGREMRDDEEYVVATISYIAAANEGFIGFSNHPTRDVGPIRQAVAHFAAAHSPYAPQLEGRIQFMHELRASAPQ